jgi:glycerol-3-phosphate acyltransferase PlsY
LFLSYLLLGYLIGSIPFSQFVASWRVGADLRISGYQNVGAYNVINLAGARWGFLAGFLDASKGFVTLSMVHALGAPFPTYLWAGLFVVLGHNYPVWLGFKGGKGIAVVIGLMFWIVPIETVIAVGVGFIVFFWVRLVFVSVGVGFGALILSSLLFQHFPYIQWLIYGIGILIGLAYLPRFLRWLRLKRMHPTISE